MIKFFRYSLPFRILLITFLLLVLPLLVFAFVEFRYAFVEAIRDAKKSMMSLGAQRQADLGELTSSKYLLLKEVAFLLDIPKLLPTLPNEKVNTLFKQMVELGDFWGMAINKITKTKRFINVASHDPFYLGKDYTDAYMAFRLLDLKKTNFLIYDNRPPHEKLFLSSMLIYSDKDEQNEPVASFLMAFQMTKQLNYILHPLEEPFPIRFAILTLDKLVFAASDKDLTLQLFKPMTPERRQQLISSGIYAGAPIAEKPLKVIHEKESPFFEFIFKGETQIAYELKVPDSQFSLLIYTPKRQIVSGIVRKFVSLYLIYLSLLLIGGLIVLLLTFRMAKPFKNLSNVMEEVKHQHLEARYVSDPFGFEINYLGEIFNGMIETLLKNMRRAEEEKLKSESIAAVLRIGHEVQKQLLPQKMPDYPHVEMADFFIPAKEVGGDFYDVFIQNSGGTKKLFFTIADVSGKGIRACLYSLGVRSLLRGFGKEKKNLSEVVELTNKNFYEDSADTGMFVTAFVGSFDSQTKNLTYVSCGHTPPVIKRKNGSVEVVENHGLALGVSEFENLKEKTLLLQAGDFLFLYTDGVTEAHNEKKELFGLARLIAVLHEQKNETAKEMGEAVIQKIKEFAYPAPQHDDITILILHVLD